MWFGELKVGDKFIFDFDVENEEGIIFRSLYMKTTTVKDNYYTYNAITLSGKNKRRFLEVGKYESIIPIE